MFKYYLMCLPALILLAICLFYVPEVAIALGAVVSMLMFPIGLFNIIAKHLQQRD